MIYISISFFKTLIDVYLKFLKQNFNCYKIFNNKIDKYKLSFSIKFYFLFFNL